MTSQELKRLHIEQNILNQKILECEKSIIEEKLHDFLLKSNKHETILLSNMKTTQYFVKYDQLCKTNNVHITLSNNEYSISIERKVSCYDLQCGGGYRCSLELMFGEHLLYGDYSGYCAGHDYVYCPECDLYNCKTFGLRPKIIGLLIEILNCVNQFRTI